MAGIDRSVMSSNSIPAGSFKDAKDLPRYPRSEEDGAPRPTSTIRACHRRRPPSSPFRAARSCCPTGGPARDGRWT